MLLTRDPLVPVGVVGRNGGLAALEDFNSVGAGNDNRQTRGNTKTLLGTSDNNIQVPFIETDLLRANRANTINNNQSLRGVGLDDLSYALDIGKDTSAK